MRRSAVLASHTVETVLQEVAALVLASAVIARLRVSTATDLKVPPTQLSFFKFMLETQNLWGTFTLLGSTLTAVQRANTLAPYLENVRHSALLPERRDRSCPRGVRQPVSGWSRKVCQPSHVGEIEIKITCV